MSDHEERLERYLSGDLSPEERVSFEDRILSDPQLIDRVYRDANLVAAIEASARAKREQARPAADSRPWWRRPVMGWMAPLAATATLLTVLMSVRPEPPAQTPVFRGSGPDTATFEPQDTVPVRPLRFVWTPFDDASYYRFELFDRASTPVFSTVTAETELALDARNPAPEDGYWVLTPLDDIRVTAGDAVVIRYTTAP